METYKEIFKSYDIRGIYNSQINEKITENIGKLFAKLLKKLNKSKNHKLRVIIGRDCRISSKKLYNAFIKGIISQNVEITKVSECSTDMINFATKFYNFNGGVMITASHNPKEYNGIKLYGPSGESIGKNEGLFLIKNWLEKKDIPKSTKKGNIKYKNILDDYINYLIKITKINQIKPIKVVLDAGNGMAVKLINKMEEKIHKIKFLKLNFKIDGNFPGRGPNPVLKGALKKLQTKCKKLKTFGIAFDGDADRAVFVDETGRIVNGDFVLCLLSKYFLNKNKNKKIIYNVMGSRIVKETIKKYKGIPIIAPVGHTHIQNLMKKQKAILGGETSGHYFFENFFYIDSGALAMLYIIKIVSKFQKGLYSLSKEFKKYYNSQEINIEIEKKQEAIKLLKNKYKAGKLIDIDGIRIEFRNWWFCARPSNTEPVLRLVIEANTKSLLNQKKKEILKLIKSLC